VIFASVSLKWLTDATDVVARQHLRIVQWISLCGNIDVMNELMIARRHYLQASLGAAISFSSPYVCCAAPEVGQQRKKSVIFLWMNGGPSHIDMWDPKPDAPVEIRGPFAPIATSQPGTFVTEHLPGHARIMDRLTLVRSIDCTACEHDPNTVMQTGNTAASPRTNPQADRLPAMGSIVSKFRGANHRGLPAYVTFHVTNGSIARGGALGRQFDPYHGNLGAGPFERAAGLDDARLGQRRELVNQLDRFHGGRDLAGITESHGRFREEAIEIVLGGRAREAFDLQRESQSVRQRYERVPWIDQFGRRGKMNEQVLLARRLVEAGVTFVTVVMSAYGNSATWDTHGNPVKTAYGGVESGTKPLLAPFDHLLTTLVEDLEERGLLDTTLVVALGEFGRSPKINKNTGRDHWKPVGCGVLAGGGLRHGQTIGATDRHGGEIAARPVRPGDLAATIYRHLDIPLNTKYVDPNGRPHYIVEGGKPLAELF